MLTAPEALVVEFCQLVLRMARREPPPGFTYLCREDFLLDRARFWKQGPHTVPDRGTPKQCFSNAYFLALRSKGALHYVEGLAMASVLPVHHAWCITSDGVVVDTTWVGSRFRRWRNEPTSGAGSPTT